MMYKVYNDKVQYKVLMYIKVIGKVGMCTYVFDYVILKFEKKADIEKILSFKIRFSFQLMQNKKSKYALLVFIFNSKHCS